ncbi:MAG: hypothetical protein WC718_04040 [Phycisphaerales bacterium]|jgi:hypothetical protein
MKLCVIGALAAFAASAGSAHAITYSYDRTGGPNNADGGALSSIHSTFDSVTNRFTWTCTFDNRITDGFTLVVSPNANPKGHPGELAIIYFDNRTLSAPKLSVYNYNANNDQTSYRDGSNAAGTQAPDRIMSSVSASTFVNSLSATNVSGNKRTLSFDIDATLINTHAPLYPNAAGNDWTGVEYGNDAAHPNRIGLWFHPVAGLTASYNADGYLSNWSASHEGWLDLSGGTVTPAPGSVALLAIGSLVATRRKR